MEAGELVQSKPWLNVTISQNETERELKAKKGLGRGRGRQVWLGVAVYNCLKPPKFEERKQEGRQRENDFLFCFLI